jgi:hypothetical protein
MNETEHFPTSREQIAARQAKQPATQATATYTTEDANYTHHGNWGHPKGDRCLECEMTDKFLTRCICGIPSDTGLCLHVKREPPRQPTSDTGGEWRVHKNKREIVNDRGFYVAFVTDEATAAQIVADHNAVKVLVGALEAAMRIVSDRAAGGRMLTTADEADKTWKLCQAAITAARLDQEEGYGPYIKDETYEFNRVDLENDK